MLAIFNIMAIVIIMRCRTVASWMDSLEVTYICDLTQSLPRQLAHISTASMISSSECSEGVFYHASY